MLATYKYPEVPDQDKSDSGNLLFGIQTGESTTPLTFYTGGNNSAIVRFEAVKFNSLKQEVDRITLSNALIVVDATNSIYKVTGLTDYNELLENGAYRFEFENDTNIWTSEYFKVNDYNPGFVLSINTSLGTGNNFQLPLPSGVDYDFIVNWGDGTSDTITAYNQAETLHAYSGAFTGNISITGKCEGWSFNNLGDKLKITTARLFGDSLISVNSAFYGCQNLTVLDVANWDISGVTDFHNFANDCRLLRVLDVEGWNTSNITDFGGFVENCFVLTALDVANWDTSNVVDFSTFVGSCVALTSLDVSTWDTSSVTNFNGFIIVCTALTSLDVSNWNTSNVTDFHNFANGCANLTTLNVSNWDTSSVIDFGAFTATCPALTTLNVTDWDTSSVVDFDFFVRACTSLTVLDVSGWNTSSVEDFSSFITLCTGIIILDTSTWDTSSVTDFGNFASSCTALTSFFIDTKYWNRTVPVPVFAHCFTGALSISNYASIPNNWKGL